MRHQKAGRKFGRTADHRQAMTRNQVTALLRHGRIRTTEAKAKELRRWVERVITTAKPGDVHAHRQVALWVNDRDVSQKLFSTEKLALRTGVKMASMGITPIGCPSFLLRSAGT